jgi:peptidyl-prolyl cis-trans isomerase A (cyclophilin A)
LFLATTLAFMVACGSEPTPADPPDEKAQTEKKAEEAKTPEPPKPPPAAEAAAETPETPLYKPELATETAPDTYAVKFETTKGEFIVDVTRAWSPLGADRFYNLVKAGFYDDAGFFRVVPGFVVQFGLHGDPAVNKAWKRARIKDDKVLESNKRGTMVFATSGPNSRTTQVFINFGDNPNLDGMGFSPFGKVRDMKNVDAITAEYGQKPNQGRITLQGNEYLKSTFPNLDFSVKATIME